GVWIHNRRGGGDVRGRRLVGRPPGPRPNRCGVTSMNNPAFGAKPAVLRCGRCGKVVDWEVARLQVVCGCRPHLDLPPVLVREATEADRAAARELFERDFGRTQIVAFDEVMDIDAMPALVAIVHADPSGALAYRLLGDALPLV